MKILKIACIVALAAGFSFAQDAVKVVIDKVELTSYNKDYIENPVYSLFQFNASHQGISGSGKLLQDLGFELKDNIEIFAIEDDGPHLLTTASDINVCDVLTSGFTELEELLKFGNFTKCPMKAGYYAIGNTPLDSSQIPPSIPRGKFLIDIKTYNGATELLHTKTYATVSDP